MKMRYWTIQTLEVWEDAQKKGFIEANEQKIIECWDYDHWIYCYKWMIEQMNKKINHNGEYPIWLWLVKPDLRKSHGEKGTPFVRLEVELDEKMVLVSDFDAWHIPLNNGFLALTEEEDNLYDKGKVTMTKEESWERIFQPDLLTGEYWRGEKLFQGVTGKIPLEKVKKVEHFVSR